MQEKVWEAMKKLRMDLLSLLVLALLAGGGIVIWGERFGIKTPEERGFWLSVAACCTIVLAIIVSFDRLGRWSDAMRTLGKWLRVRRPEMAGTTQAIVLAADVPAKAASRGANHFAKP
ncbi:hypothetical protein ACU4GI_04850 [Cupriavidus basilensis]